MNSAPPTFTNYTLLCRVPTEDDKLYYWENFQKIIPLFDPLMARFALTKVLSWQHFNRMRWNAETGCNHSSSRDAPTGGSNNRWRTADLQKVFTLYLHDRTLHRQAFAGDRGPMRLPPADKRGYISHYMTLVLGNIAPLRAIGGTDWYNRQTDFRFQIPYYFGQFPDTNMMLEFCFKDGWMPRPAQAELVRAVARVTHCTAVYWRGDIAAPGFVETFERTTTDRRDDRSLWQPLHV